MEGNSYYYWNRAGNVALATVRFGAERRTDEDQSQAESSTGPWAPEGFDTSGNNGATGPTGYEVGAAQYANGWAPELRPQPPRCTTFPGAYVSQSDYASTLSSPVGTDDTRGLGYLAEDDGFNDRAKDRGFDHSIKSTEKKSRLGFFGRRPKANTTSNATVTPQDPLHGRLPAQLPPMRTDSLPSSFSGHSSSQFNQHMQSQPSWSGTPTLISNSTGQMPIPQSTPQNAQGYGAAPAFTQQFSADPIEDTNLYDYSQAGAGGQTYGTQNMHGMGVASPPPQHGQAGSGSVTDYRMSICQHPRNA